MLEEAPRLASDALKAMAVAASHERLEEIPGLQMVGLVHDEVLLVSEEHAERAAEWLTVIMEGVGESVVNGDRPPEERVPIVADTHVCTSWADKNCAIRGR